MTAQEEAMTEGRSEPSAPQEHDLSVAECPQCKQESRFRHLHETVYGMEGTHMAGSERFECAFCTFVVTPSMAKQFPTLLFVLDGVQ